MAGSEELLINGSWLFGKHTSCRSTRTWKADFNRGICAATERLMKPDAPTESERRSIPKFTGREEW